jgi:hypothetical protein
MGILSKHYFGDSDNDVPPDTDIVEVHGPGGCPEGAWGTLQKTGICTWCQKPLVGELCDSCDEIWEPVGLEYVAAIRLTLKDGTQKVVPFPGEDDETVDRWCLTLSRAADVSEARTIKIRR